MTGRILTPEQTVQLVQLATAREMAALSRFAEIKRQQGDLRASIEKTRARMIDDAFEPSGLSFSQLQKWREKELTRLQLHLAQLEVALCSERDQAFRRTAEKSICDQLHATAINARKRQFEEKRQQDFSCPRATRLLGERYP